MLSGDCSWQRVCYRVNGGEYGCSTWTMRSEKKKNSGRTLEQTPFYSKGLSKSSPQAEQR